MPGARTEHRRKNRRNINGTSTEHRRNIDGTSNNLRMRPAPNPGRAGPRRHRKGPKATTTQTEKEILRFRWNAPPPAPPLDLCHRTQLQGVWDEAIVAATEGAKATAAERARGALDRGRRANRLLGSADLARGAPIAEVALRAGATKSLVLGFARPRVDEQLKVGRAPIRALANVRRAFDKAAKQAARQGGGCPPAGMPAAGQGRPAARGSRSRPPGPNARRPLRGGGRGAAWRNISRLQYRLAAKAGSLIHCRNGVIVAATV